MSAFNQIASDDTALLINAYLDGEMSAGEAFAMERRLNAEPELRAKAEQMRALSSALRVTLADQATPAGLSDRVAERLGFYKFEPARRVAGRFTIFPQSVALAATLVLTLGLGGLIGAGAVYFGTETRSFALSEAVITSHLRALAAPQPFDIASADGHVVKPWFNGRTTLAPATPDLADKGFPLAGGRVDIVADRPVPTLVYRRRQHVISLTIIPAIAGSTAREEHHDGLTVEHWTAGDVTYLAVSDLNARELREFATEFGMRVARDE